MAAEEQASTIEQRAQMRRVLRVLVNAAGGPKLFAEQTRVSAGHISKSLEEHYTEEMTLDVAIDAMVVSGSPVLVAFMASLIGYEVVRSDAASGSEINLGHAMDVALAGNDVMHTVRRAFEDGRLVETERREIVASLNKTMEQVQTALRAVGGGQ